MRTSSNGAKAICCWEAMVLVAYPDPRGQDKTWSIGPGLQKVFSTPVKRGDTITLDHAFTAFRHHLTLNDGWLRNLIKIEVPQYAWDALACFTYNARADWVKDVMTQINDKGLRLGALAMAQHHGNNPGIAFRRAEEVFRCTHDWYGDITRFKLYEHNPDATSYRWAEFPQEI